MTFPACDYFQVSSARKCTQLEETNVGYVASKWAILYRLGFVRCFIPSAVIANHGGNQAHLYNLPHLCKHATKIVFRRPILKNERKKRWLRFCSCLMRIDGLTVADVAYKTKTSSGDGAGCYCTRSHVHYLDISQLRLRSYTAFFRRSIALLLDNQAQNKQVIINKYSKISS